MMLSRYFLIITLLSTLPYHHLIPSVPHHLPQETTEHHTMPHEEFPFNEATLQAMITHLAERLPQEHKPIAPQLAFLFVLNGIQDATKVPDEQLKMYAQQMNEAMRQNEAQLQKEEMGRGKGDHFPAHGSMPTIDLKAVLAECEKTNVFTPRLSIATAAYLIYRRLFEVHKNLTPDKISWVPTRMIDWSLRFAAFIATGKYKIEKYWPLVHTLALEANV